MKKLLFIAIAVTVLSLSITSGLALAHDPEPYELSVSPASVQVEQGSTVYLSGVISHAGVHEGLTSNVSIIHPSYLPSGSVYEFTPLYSDDNEWNFSLSITVPADAPLDTYDVPIIARWSDSGPLWIEIVHIDLQVIEATQYPPGWEKGKKNGWDGDIPPGLDKKDKIPAGLVKK